MEADYLYTTGLAGERFFRELKENGRLVGTYCPRCDVLLLPPKVFCEVCFSSLDQWEEIPNKGRVVSFTVAHTDRQGEPLLHPEVWLMVGFPGVRGGLIHRTNLPVDAVVIGMEVQAVYTEERRGSLADIKYFKAI
jgi:hypothetical protein